MAPEKGYLDEPRQEENECYKVEIGAPSREAVYGSVHEEHPAFLWRGLVHCEDTCAWKKKPNTDTFHEKMSPEFPLILYNGTASLSLFIAPSPRWQSLALLCKLIQCKHLKG